MSESWYEHVGGDTPLTQGDLITDCPLTRWSDGPVAMPPGEECHEVLKAANEVVRADVVVLTQACDLAHGKLANVILCAHFALREYREIWSLEMERRGQRATDKAWIRQCDDTKDGFNWNLAILNAGRSGELEAEHRIVDFHEVFTIPRTFLESFLSQRASPRLRLLPPYREHLSQAFARFFMRVGLPVSVEPVWEPEKR